MASEGAETSWVDQPYYHSLEISGLRGFSQNRELKFAKPTGKAGSGLTLIVGPNSSGKSTIVEALTAVTQSATPAFSEGKRNASAEDRVVIKITDNQSRSRSVKTIEAGGSETKFESVGDINPTPDKVFIVQSRRNLDPYFGKSQFNRSQHKNAAQIINNARKGQSEFSARLFEINKSDENRIKFNVLLRKLLGLDTNWSIDQSDQGQYYLKIVKSHISHNSDGLGEGVLSSFFIVDALYDSEPGSMIVIDEPELSLHPQLQKRLTSMFVEYSSDRQIVVATHSSKFIHWEAIGNGALIHRVFNEDGGSNIGTLQESTRTKIESFLNDKNNPHTLGLEASEVFFLDDKVVLVEGQEDVVFLPKVLADLDLQMPGELFGWGVGGADKMHIVSSILFDLGFSKVAGIVDGDKANVLKPLSGAFPSYHFAAQPADDIRHKIEKPDKTSLLDDDGSKVRDQFREPMKALISDIDEYFRDGTE